MKYLVLGGLLGVVVATPSCTEPTAVATEPITVAAAAASAPARPGIVTLANGVAADSLAFPAILEAAFLLGTVVKQDSETYSLALKEIGKLGVPTGRLVAADPTTMSVGAAFTQRFPVGEFPVQLALVRLGENARVGYARVLFSPRRVARWQLALRPGQKPLALKDKTFYCYPVDSGMGVFVDSAANQRFKQQGAASWDDTFIKNTAPDAYTGYIHRFEGYSLATFRTGPGDGCYPTYIGLDAKGQVCRLLTDFGFVVW